MAEVKVALPGFRVPIGRTAKGELIYLEGPWREFLSGLHLRTGGDPVDKVEAATTVGTVAVAAAATANAAAATANTAAATAQTAADDAAAAAAAADAVAVGAVDAVAETQELQYLQVSGVSSGCLIVGSDTGAAARVSVNAHTRYYGDATSAAVNSGNVSSLLYDTVYFMYYDDAARTGGAVTYAVTTNENLATPTTSNPNRHYVGSCRTPVASDPDTDGSPNFYA